MVDQALREKIFAATKHTGEIPSIQTQTQLQTISLDQMAEYVGGQFDSMGTWSGEKFPGGFGITKDYTIKDYWLLRKRSKQLFDENLYARGLIRRLITNEINTGLSLEATPDADILGVDPEELSNWSENVERRFLIWGQNAAVCDVKKARTFGALQRLARTMALVSGDVLVVLRPDKNGLPAVDLIDAECVSTPLSDIAISQAAKRGNKIVYGVEIDPAGVHVAFHISQKDGTHQRISAMGERTGRRVAWLVYGTERLIGDVRGQSILALVMQSLKEIDRYRDSELRAAVVNSMIAMWIEKGEDKMSSLPMTGGAVRKDTITTQNDSQGRKDVTFSANMPGMMLQELQQGEKPQSYDTRRPNVNYATFETAIISALAWANEIPPEVLQLAFHKSYAASRGSVNEFKLYLDRVRVGFGEEFLDPIYTDWLISECLVGNVQAPGFLEAWRDSRKWDIYGAWTLTDWAGAIKPALNLLQEVKAYQVLVSEGWITRERAGRELTGMKYTKVARQQRKENEILVLALQPLIDAGLIKDQNPEIEDATVDETDETDESED